LQSIKGRTSKRVREHLQSTSPHKYQHYCMGPGGNKRFPKIEDGSVVDLSAVKGQLIAKPINEDEYSLEELLAGVTKENLHAEFNTGDAIGQEAW